MKHTAAPPSQPQKASGRSPAASQLRGGRLTKLDGEVASCAPSLGRTSSALLSSASLAGILSGAFLAMTAQEARAACTEISGAWTCTGVVTAAQSIKRSDSAISVNLDSGFDMDVAQGVGFTLEQSGAGGIAFVQAAGRQEIVGRAGALHATNSGTGGISITATGKLATTSSGAVLKAVNSDASGGSVSVSVGSVIGSGADGHAIQVTNSGSGTTAVTASGSVSSGSGEGDGVNVETGKGSSSVTISVATVTGSRTGVRVSHRGAGSVSVRATGTVKASGGYGGSHALYVANRSSAASVKVFVATVTAKGTGAVDGIHVLQMHAGAVTVIASGSVSSAGRHGIFVDRRGQSRTPGQRVHRDVYISVSGNVTGGGGYRDAAIKVNANEGDIVKIVPRNGAVVGRAGEAGIVESDGNAFVDLWAAAVNGGIRLGSGRDTLYAGWRAKISGGVDLASGNDRLKLNWDAKVSGGVNSGDGDDTLTVTNGAEVSGGVNSGDGDDTLTVTNGAEVSGGVRLLDGNDILTVSGGAEVSGTVDLGDGNNTLTISEVSRILGDVDFGSGSDTLTVGGGSKISGTVNFGSGNDNLNFGPGFSEIGAVRGAERFTFESGAVARITDTSGTDMSGLASLEIKSGAMAILDNAGHKHKVGSIRLKPGGTLNIADGVAGKSGNNSLHFNNVALLLGPDQELNGALIIDANFAQSWADVLGWDGAGTRNWRGTVLIEPAVLEGRKGNSAIVTSSLSASQIRVPQGFSVVFDTDWQQFAIRQDMESGACTGAGSGAFTCRNLIHETQSFSASGEALKVALDSSSVVHALAGTRQGLTLRQSGAGGVSLTQSASGSRIAAAGHAIHAINAGAGSVSVTLTGPVVGGLTGRVADADGIFAEGGTAGGSVHLSAASVTGLRHGIYALADGNVSVEASGSLTGRFGDGVKVTSLAKGLSSTGSVAISVATVTGGRTGVWATHRGAGSVSITSTGPVVGGLVGRMADADGIFAEGGTARGSVRLSAASVTGLRHGIYALADGAVSVEASGSLNGRFGDGVKVTSLEKGLSAAGSVAISVATVTGGRTGVWVTHGGTRSVSIRATGTVKSSGGLGHDSAITVKNHTSYSSITLAVATITAQGSGSGASGIYVVQPHRGAVAIFASGAVSSAGHHGIFVDQRSRGGNMHGDVKIGVSGLITSAAAAIKVNSDRGDVARISLESGAVVGRAGADAIIESHGNAVVDVKAGVALKGNVNLGYGNDTLIVSSATVSGGVDFGSGDNKLTVIDGATVSGNVQFGSNDDTVTVSNGATVSGDVNFGHRNDTMIVIDGATVSGDVDFGEGWNNDTLIVRGATVSGNVTFSWHENWMEVSDGAEVSGDVNFSSGNNTLIVIGATVSGDVRFGGWGLKKHDRMTVSDGATVSSGTVDFGHGNDTLTVSGATVSSDLDFGWDSDRLDFGPGFSEVIGKITGAEQFTFENGAVARIAQAPGTNRLRIKSGAIAILGNAGPELRVGSIHLKQGGTLNIADSVADSNNENGTLLRLGPDQEFNGTLIIDANFDQSWADSLVWNGSGSRNWRGTMRIEPAVLKGRKGNSAAVAIASELSASQFTAPEGFSIVHDAISGRTAIRQDMASGTCTGAGSGAFACRDLIHETQSLSATGEALDVTLDRAGVVHALAGMQRGLSLSQSGTGGISLTQSSTGSRIAAAGHAIHARNAGAGDVSVTVTGLVVGGLTGRVADADGIAAENGADGGGVRISATSVSGLRHGIAASAGGGDVSVAASGSVTGRLGDGVRAVALKGDVTVSAASAAGARAGIFGSGTEAVSISASGAVASSGGAGIDGLATGSGALSISAAEAMGAAFGIRAVSQGSGPVSVTASGMIKAMGAEGAAIYGLAAGGGSLTISAAGASGRFFGIKAVGGGSGSVSVSASGSVSSMDGASRHGVHARASGTGGLTVSVDGAVRGGETGITALGGDGDVAVTTSGGVAFGGGQVDGAAGVHAAARNGDLTVSATGEWLDRIVGYGDGIRAVSSGTGAVSISAAMEVQTRNGDAIVVNRTKAGSVGISVSNLIMAWRTQGTAGTLAAIRTDAPSDSSVTISLNSGARLTMAGADAVAGGAGDATVTVKSGATVQGRIALGSGTDTLVFDGGAFSGVERMDGGAGADTLMFRRGTGTLHATVRSEGLKGWERIVVESGAALSGDVRLAGDSGSLEFRGSAPSGALDGGSGTANTLSLVNVGTASVPAANLTGWETVGIGAGSNVAFGTGAHTLTAGTLNVETGGVLNVGKDADTGDALTVSGDFAGGGTVTLNANFMPNAGASDRLTVTGDARGATSVVFAKVGESGTVDDTARPMRIDGVISVAGAVGAGAFVLGSPIQFGTVSYSLAFDADSGEYDLLRTGAGGDAGALSHGAAAAAGALHFGPAAAEALHSGPASAAALHMGSAATAATLGAQPAAAGLAAASRAACTEAPLGSGALSCGGARIGSPQRLGATGATALSVNLDTRTEVDTNGTAFSLTQSGTGGIAFERKAGGAAIRAKGDAIAARNAGGGSVSIAAGGAIAAGGDGVSAVSDADGEGVRIDVATVAAGGDGVSVDAAAGDVFVTADDAKGRGAGIRVRTGDGGTGVEISAGSAEGGTDGISVDHGGSGEVRITATGAVSGARGDGVHARSEAGHVSVRVSGAVSGGAAAGGAAIRTDGRGAAAVTLESGASVRAAGGGSAVMDGAGAALVTVREGASILGGVSLGAGADELVLAGGDFGGITSLDGGPGRDALRIEAGRGSLPALSNGAVSGVESVIVTGDAWIEGDLLLAEDAGELVFADGARIDGHGRLDGGGGASLSLRGVSGEMDAARLSGWTSLEIGEDSRVTLAGSGLGRDAAESLFVAGTMAFGSDARAGDAFTVEGDFEGGGRVEIDADLAAGSADRLAIEGDVSGTTEIALRDLTPSGAEPSGAEMTVVSVGGEADASAFRLAGGAVARGAFLYDLRMAPDGGGFALVADGGVSDTGAALQSASSAIARGLARATTLQARAAARAVASVWARVGSAATFAERGAALAGRDAVDLSTRESRSVWMRFHGDRWDYGAGGAASIDSSGFEVGMDLLSRESSAGKWIAGLTAQYGTVGAEAAAGGGVGRQGAFGYGVGATLSWLGQGGFYADAQAQAGISDSDFSSDTGGAIRSGVSARTAVAALELGWRVAASDSATIVPQAQISMSGVSGDGFVSGSLDVADRAATSLDGRVGLAAEIALREGYLRFSGSLLRALSEMDGTVVNGRIVEHGLPDGWAEFAVGGSLDLSEDRVLFLDGTWRTGLGGAGGDVGGASISGGLKVNW